VYSNPEVGDYRSLQIFKDDDRLPVTGLGTGAAEIPLADILS